MKVIVVLPVPAPVRLVEQLDAFVAQDLGRLPPAGHSAVSCCARLRPVQEAGAVDPDGRRRKEMIAALGAQLVDRSRS